MKIFFSHASSRKSLIREIKRFLPPSLKLWIDEEQLFIGVELEKTLKEVIDIETDILLFFICSSSVKSCWVEKEVNWALKVEKK